MENEILSILPLPKQGKKKMFEIRFLSGGIEHSSILTKRSMKRDFFLTTAEIDEIVLTSIKNYGEPEEDEDEEEDFRG
jgi:hypothetical protein